MVKRSLNFFALVFCIFFGLNNVGATSVTEEIHTVDELNTCLASNQKTCKLVENIIFDSTANFIVTKSITLDLNGHEVKGPMVNGLLIYGGNLIAIDSSNERDGKFINTAAGKYGLSIFANGNLTVEGGYYKGDYAGLYAYKTDTVENVTVNGGVIEGKNVGVTVSDNDTFIMNNGEIRGLYTTIATNGQSFNTIITINGGKLIQTDNEYLIIYHPSEGVLNLNGGILTGGIGIEMRAGTLNIPKESTVEIYANLNEDIVTRVSDNGSTVSGGNILAISQHSTKKPININIAGGKMYGRSMIYEFNPMGNSQDDLNKININITGGTFNTINNGTDPVYSADFSNFISGGIFTVSPDLAYVSNEKQVKVIDGKYHVTDFDRDINYLKVENGVEENIVNIITTDNIKNILIENVNLDIIKNKNVEFKLSFENITDSISVDDKNIIDTVSSTINNFNLINYEDITITVIDKSNNSILEQINELNSKIKLSINIPEDLPTVSKGYKRDFYIIRMHDGVAEKLDCEVSEDGKSLVFESDKFSVYAYGYVDTVMPNTPPTFDNVSKYILLAISSLVIIISSIIIINKKRLN